MSTADRCVIVGPPSGATVAVNLGGPEHLSMLRLAGVLAGDGDLDLLFRDVDAVRRVRDALSELERFADAHTATPGTRIAASLAAVRRPADCLVTVDDTQHVRRFTVVADDTPAGASG